MKHRFFLVAILLWVFSSRASAQPAEAPVVVSHGDITVTELDVKRYLKDRVPASRRGDFLIRGDAVRRLAENLLVIRILGEEAAREGGVDTELVDWQVAVHRDRLMMNYYLDRIVEAGTANINWEQTAKEVYLAEPDAFNEEEQVEASHILVSNEDRSDEEARALAEKILAELEAGGDMAQLAREYSDDPSAASNGGNLGSFGRKKMTAPFDEAVFALREPGELAGPVKTRFGYHVIRLEAYMPEHQRPFDEVKGTIIESLKKEIPNTIRQNKVTEVRSSPTIEYNAEHLESLLATLREQYSQSR